MQLANSNQLIDISRFSDKPEIATIQKETIIHALSVNAQLRAETSPEYQETKRTKLKVEQELTENRNIHESLKILALVFCFIFIIGFGSKMQASFPVIPPRTVEQGDLETTNKILQRDLMLTKRELDIKTREVDMLARELSEKAKLASE